MRGESMKDKSKKSTYSTTFGIDPKIQAQEEMSKQAQVDKRSAYAKNICAVKYPG